MVVLLRSLHLEKLYAAIDIAGLSLAPGTRARVAGNRMKGNWTRANDPLPLTLTKQ